MYEGNILNLGSIASGFDPRSGVENLRALSWGELVARLDAARDFGRLMGGGDRMNRGSFDCSSARHIAAMEGGIPRINPFALTNRKSAEGMSLNVIDDMNTCDRGRQ